MCLARNTIFSAPSPFKIELEFYFSYINIGIDFELANSSIDWLEGKLYQFDLEINSRESVIINHKVADIVLLMKISNLISFYVSLSKVSSIELSIWWN